MCRGALIGRRLEQFLAPQTQAHLRRFLVRLFDGGAHAVMEAPLFDAATPDGASPLRRVRIEANLDASAAICRMILTDMGAVMCAMPRVCAPCRYWTASTRA